MKMNKNGTFEVWVGVVFAIIFFVVLYMFVNYLGFLGIDYVEKAMNDTLNFGSSIFYDKYRSSRDDFVDFLDMMPVLAFFSIVLTIAYYHFIYVRRGRVVRRR